jgi:acyl carrier protein
VTTTTTLADVKELLVEVLGLHGREDELTESTALFGSLPELDSLAIVELITTIEDRFAVEMDDADITGETFETVGSLAAYVQRLGG